VTSQVEVAIANGQDDEDLLLLRNEMKELISLTEQSLVSYEKSKLITMVDGETQVIVTMCVGTPLIRFSEMVCCYSFVETLK